MVSSISASFERKKLKWYQRRPLIKKAVVTDLQYGSYVATIYTMVECALMIVLAIFDVYCLAEASPGSIHYRYFGISFLFVYSGNQHVRNLLILCSVVSFVLAVVLLVTSFMLMKALKKEIESKFKPWLVAMLVFTGWRFIAIFYRSTVNDLYFSYHQAMLAIWIILMGVNAFMWLIVMSNYQVLADLTKLEDMAKLKMGTMSSLNQSHSLSRHSVDSVKPNTTTTRSTTPKSSLSANSA